MKNIIAVSLVLLIGAGMLLLIGCQSKEVTSAKVYIQQDDWDKAIEQLELAVQAFPNDAEAHMLLGRGYGKKGQFKRMVEAFEASLAAGPLFEKDIDHERAYYWTTGFNIGVKAFNNEKLDDAIERFSTCIMIDSGRVEGYKNLANCHQKQKNIEKAIAIYTTLLQRQPKDAGTMLRLHDLYVQTKQLDKALDVLNKAKEIEPQNVDILSALAITYDMKGDTTMAFQVYHEAIKHNPDNVDLLFNLGRLYFMRGDHSSAISYFDKVIAMNPNDFESNLNIGNAYLSIAEKMDKERKAKEEKLDKELPDERAKVKSLYAKVIPYLQKALEAKPEQAGVWNNLGVAYIRSDQMEKGKEAFKKGEELSK